eukprot:gene1761-biopygen1320
MESKSLKTRSKVQYMKTLLSILAKKEPLYITYLAGLQRLQAGEQLDQAVAMTVQDMRTLIQQFPNWTDKLVLRLAWMTASRWGEIESLTTAHFRELDIPVLVLDWWTLPKTSKEQPNRPYRYHKFTGEMRLQIRKLIHHLGPDQPLTKITGDQLRRVMRALGQRTNDIHKQRYYTAHSIKRGALRSAAELAAAKNLDPRMVPTLGKHRDLHDAQSATTISYLGPYAALLSNIDKLTALLDDLLMKS